MATNDYPTRISVIDYISKADDYVQTLSYEGDNVTKVVHRSVTSKKQVTENLAYNGSNQLETVTRTVEDI